MIGPKTRRDTFPKAAMVLVTTTFVRVILPVLVTVPVTVRSWPGCTNPAGHTFTTSMLGLFVPGHALVSLSVTTRPKHLSAPLATNVSVYGPHESSGTV